MAFERKYTEEQYSEAKQLIDAGATIREAADTVGVPYQSVYRRVRKPDPIPGARTRARPAPPAGDDTPPARPRARRSSNRKVEPASTITDAKLQSFFSKVAMAPAIPMMTVVRCDYCANHFISSADATAMQLVALSKDNATLRQTMELIYTYLQQGAWGMLLLTWIGLPVAHHFLPDRFYGYAQMVTNLPSRGHAHAHAQPSPNGHTPPPPGGPLGDMDLGQLMRMAQMAGFSFPPDVGFAPDEPIAQQGADEVATPEPAPDGTAGAAPDGTAVTDVTADPAAEQQQA